MIELKRIAELFENGLNQTYGNSEIQFHIWATAGRFDQPYREGNTVTRFIVGNIRTSSSSNDANLLVMGTNGLTIEFAIPVKRPRTNATQKEAELQEVSDGQLTFVNEIVSVIDNYFKNASSTEIGDGEDTYSVSFQAGTSVSGTVDIISGIGNCVLVTVYVQMYFILGGTISNDVSVTIDGVRIPFQYVQIGRSNQTERDVYAGSLVSKSMSSSSIFSIDLKFPSNADVATQETIGFLINGTPNTAHFVKVQWGDSADRMYLMAIENVSGTAQGVTIAGISAALTEAVENLSLLNFPETYYLGKFYFDDTTATGITFKLYQTAEVCLAGNVFEAVGREEYTVELSPENYEYDEEQDCFFVYTVANRDLKYDLMSSSAPYLKSDDAVIAVSGIWKWNDTLSFGTFEELGLSFQSNGAQYNEISSYAVTGGETQLVYGSESGNGYVVYKDKQWLDVAYQTIDFGSGKQFVSKTFYDYLTQNATREE